jgi:hypothetical protein
MPQVSEKNICHLMATWNLTWTPLERCQPGTEPGPATSSPSQQKSIVWRAAFNVNNLFLNPCTVIMLIWNDQAEEIRESINCGENPPVMCNFSS